jgi:hypothetical protein
LRSPPKAQRHGAGRTEGSGPVIDPCASPFNPALRGTLPCTPCDS